MLAVSLPRSLRLLAPVCILALLAVPAPAVGGTCAGNPGYPNDPDYAPAERGTSSEATWNDEQGVILKRDINVGVPVDVGEDKGLIVPVIHGADNYSVTGLARRASRVSWVCPLARRNGSIISVKTWCPAGPDSRPASIRYLPAGRRIRPIPPGVRTRREFPALLAASKTRAVSTAGLPFLPIADRVSV